MNRRGALALLGILLPTSYAGAGTIAYYRFENGVAGSPATGTGTILDSSGNGLNGTAFNEPVYSSNVPVNTIPNTGASNALSLSFNGTTQRVFVPDSALFAVPNVTVEAYIYCTGAPQNSYGFGNIFWRGDNRAATDPYFLAVTGNGTTATFQIENTAIVNATIPLNQWIFVAGTYNASTDTQSIYVNGQLKSSITSSISPDGTLLSQDIPGEAIGSLEVDAGAEVFPGLIDEVRISNQALSPSQFLDAVPEPTSCGVILAGGTAALIRRRRRVAAD